jgi:hypothetical protein
MQQTLKDSSERVVVYSHLRSRRVARSISRRQLLFSVFLILLFMPAFVTFINHVMKLIQNDSFSHPVWKVFLSNGLSILARLAGLSVKGLSGHEPSIFILTTKNPDIVLSSPCGLDPKRAKAFNRPVVNCYFDKLTSLVESLGIPIKNLYNMDEKGCQRGGRKRSSRRRYFYSRWQRAKYKHRSANLELITIIEAICADGTELKPGFVFPGSSFCPEWFEKHPDIVYELIYFFPFLF